MKTRGLAFVLVMLAVLAPLRAHAGDKRVAAAHFQKGRALYDAASWADALDEFKAGYEAYPLPAFYVNIGQCLRKLDRIDEAADAFRKFLDTNPTDARLRVEVEEAYAEVKTDLDRRSEVNDKRKRDEEQARQSLLASIAREQRAQAREQTIPTREVNRRIDLNMRQQPIVASSTTELRNDTPPPKAGKPSRWWIWTIVGVVAAGAVAGGVAGAVIATQPVQPHAGSLGLLDGRR
jgi:tetratricopeptide (TPR) repeat protein